MSFILDALKKSETDRQQQGSAEFTGVPTSTRREGPPRWLWVVGVLLAINLAVLLGLLLRPEAGTPPVVTEQAADPGTDDGGDFASQVAVARQNAPAREVPQPVPEQAVRTESQTLPAATITAAPATNTATIPTIHEVLANGTLSLPELHVDIHVYSESAVDRFVFINMNKHNEGSRLAEGPLVQEITPDGVVLNQNGTTFLLPRD